MKKIMATGLLTAAGLAAGVGVSDVQLAESSLVGNPVQVTFTLDGPAIVTMRFFTNEVADASSWLPVADADATDVWGDVNRIVPSGVCTNWWKPERALPGLLLGAGRLKAEIRAWPLDNPPDYRVFDLTSTNRASMRYYVSSNAVPGGVQAEVYKTDKLVMRRIPAAGIVWTMGSPADEQGRTSGNRENQHQVKLLHDYYIGIYELTRGQYCRILTNENAAAHMKGWDQPNWRLRPIASPTNGTAVTYISMRGSVSQGINWPTTGRAVLEGSPLDLLRKLTGVEFDLPTDAQWEFACRAGTTGKFPCGTEEVTAANMGTFAWYTGHRNGDYPEPVGSLLPNAWGLYDMLGNVFERCLDYMNVKKTLPGTAESPDEEPLGFTTTATNPTRVSRGGSFAYDAGNARSARRAADADNYVVKYDYGFRLACPLGTEWGWPE